MADSILTASGMRRGREITLYLDRLFPRLNTAAMVHAAGEVGQWTEALKCIGLFQEARAYERERMAISQVR